MKSSAVKKWLRQHARILAGCIGALLSACVVAVNAIAYRHARAMTCFALSGIQTASPEKLAPLAKIGVLLRGVTIPRPVSDRVPSDLDPECRQLHIEGKGGVTLSAWYCGVGDRNPLVVMFHGYAAEKTTLLPEARELLSMNMSILLVDFRGSGGSSEAYTTVGVREADDVAVAVEYARKELGCQHVILFGRSMGAAAVLRAVAECNVCPDGVILEAVFDTMLNTVRNRFRAMHLPSFPAARLLVFWGGRLWGFDGFVHNPEDYARALTCPVLFLHGSEDPRATLAQARGVFENVSSAKTFVTFEGVGHQPYFVAYPDLWRNSISEFVRQTD